LFILAKKKLTNQKLREAGQQLVRRLTVNQPLPV
jgi:hypothetical protein